MSDWLLVSGDFSRHGGMDMANLALASWLARHASGAVHVVAHDVDPELARMPRVHWTRAVRPLGMQMFGEPMLRSVALRRAAALRSRGVHIIANGGNVDAGDVCWIHYVHAAHEPRGAGIANRTKVARNHRRHLEEERRALAGARLVICNSHRTVADVMRAAAVPRDRVRLVYYGIDPSRFGPVTAEERRAARRALGVADERRLAVFAGALGDRRKGFDTLFKAWQEVCADPGWDVDLCAAGAGAELRAWRARAERELPRGRVRLAGFHRDMPALLAAADLMVHPARYEAYGLGVHEALCRGVPAIVSAHAGVAERYPEDLHPLLLSDPESVSELVDKLRAWRATGSLAARVALFAGRLRARTWDHMAREIVDAVEQSAA